METDDSTEGKNTSVSSSSGFNPREDNDSSAKELSVPTGKRARSDVAGEIPIPVAEPGQVHVTAGEKRLFQKILWIGKWKMLEMNVLRAGLV